MKSDLKKSLIMGAVGGVVAGMMMGIFEMVVGLLQSMSFFAPLDVIGHILNQRVSLMHNSPKLIIEGLIIHMAMSMALGMAIALLVWLVPAIKRLSPAGITALSAAISLTVGILNEYVIWAAIDGSATSMLRPVTFLLGHLLFGVVIGIVISKTLQSKVVLFSA